MCIARSPGVNPKSLDKDESNECNITRSCVLLYSGASNELLSTNWLMHFLRQIEDGENLSKYFTNLRLKELMTSNICSIDEAGKKIALWKIKSIKKRNLKTEIPYLNYIENLLLKNYSKINKD